MNKSETTKQERFEKLLETYAIALHLTYQIMDSGILESKIKLGNDAEQITNFIRKFLPAFANDIRYAERVKGSITNTSTSARQHEGALDIALAYFDELNVNGSSWEFADLEDMFIEYKNQAEGAIEAMKERGY